MMDLELFLAYCTIFFGGMLLGAGSLAWYAIRVSKREKEKHERSEYEK